MLNLGQVVYDLTNKRVLIFGGISMLQNQESGKCHTEINFLTEDLEQLNYGKDNPTPFKYRNFAVVDGKIPCGDFMTAAELTGHFFGNVNFDLALQITENVEAVKRTFEMAKALTPPEPIEEVDSNG